MRMATRLGNQVAITDSNSLSARSVPCGAASFMTSASVTGGNVPLTCQGTVKVSMFE